MRVLMTGAAGLIGTWLRRLMSDRIEFRCVDVKPGEGDWHRLDISSWEAIPRLQRLMRGMDGVFHLAIASRRAFPREAEDAFHEAEMEVNAKGTYHVFEAARRAEVPRVVYMSSLTVVLGYPPHRWVGLEDPVCPQSLYAVTKYFGEVLAELYWRRYGLSSISFRLGAPVDAATYTPPPEGDRAYALRVTFQEIADAYWLALTRREEVPFGVFYLLSENQDLRWDLEPTKRRLGYRPRYRFTPQGIKALEMAET